MNLVNMVKREAKLAARPGARRTDEDYFLLPPEPPGTKYRFGWEPIAQANPKDDAIVNEKLLALGLTCPEMMLSEMGISEDAILDSLAETNKKRVARGLAPVKLGNPKQNDNDNPDKESNVQENESTPKKKRQEAATAN